MPKTQQGAAWVSRLSAAVLAVALAATPPDRGFGQTTPSGGGSDSSWGSGGSAEAALSDYSTNAIVRNIAAVRDECRQYEPAYRIDCLSKGLREVARRVPNSGDYREARRVIAQAASRLASVQSANTDAARPKQRSRGNARIQRARNYSAVKRENLRQAMQQATQVIEEAETRLLRSAENSAKRSSHYQKIAAAVGSTKVLMRSA